MSGTTTVTISEQALFAIRYALRIALADAQIDYAKAEYEYDKEAMGPLGRRIGDIEKALDELPER